jgi:predicted Zn-dependent protease
MRSAQQDANRFAVDEVQRGSALARRGKFSEAIPHLLAARNQGQSAFATEFNLALCYVGIRQFDHAIDILRVLAETNTGNANVYNLLAQAYIGTGQILQAIEALNKASAVTPQNEKLYLLVGDACMEAAQFAAGLDVVNLGLKNLPRSPGLHYQRGMFLALLDQFDAAKPDFELASQLGQGREIAFLAAAQMETFEGNMPEVVRITREGIKAGHETAAMYTMLGDALARSGANPGQPEFLEAVRSLEKSLAVQPENSTARIALGRLYLLDNRVKDAIEQLEAARQREPSSAAVYSNLAKAYRRSGDQAKAQQMLTALSRLNTAQAERIREAPGERKSSYLGSRPKQ